MSNIPKTLNEARRDRASAKRNITNLLKEGDSLLTADSGLLNTEFRKLAERIREQLDILHVKNELYINLKYSVLVLGKTLPMRKGELKKKQLLTLKPNTLMKLETGPYL